MLAELIRRTGKYFIGTDTEDFPVYFKVFSLGIDLVINIVQLQSANRKKTYCKIWETAGRSSNLNIIKYKIRI